MDDVRRECKQCGIHTFRSRCGNCGSVELMAVTARKTASRRFAREGALRLRELAGVSGLRSGSAF